MSGHLLLISLGPVQDFIASARRSRDLWFGSYLLAELSKCVARSIASSEGLEALIFPAPDSLVDLGPWDRTGFNVVNVILAKVADPVAVARDAKLAVIAFLQDAAKEVFEPLTGNPSRPAKVSLPEVQIKLAYAQIENLLDGPGGDLAAPAEIGRAKRIEDAQARYIEFAKRTFPKDLSLGGLRVVVDTAHGCGAGRDSFTVGAD